MLKIIDVKKKSRIFQNQEQNKVAKINWEDKIIVEKAKDSASTLVICSKNTLIAQSKSF